MIVCLNLNKSHLGKFELEILSDQKLKRITLNNNFSRRKKIVINGLWADNSSGGCTGEITFNRNPKYEISTENHETNLFIELISKEKFSIGIAVFEIFKNNYDIDLSKIQCLIKNLSLKEEFNFIQHKLEKNKKYIIVPFTHKYNQRGQYEINIFSDVILEINEIQYKTHCQLLEFEWLKIDEKVSKRIALVLDGKFENRQIFNCYFSLKLNLMTEKSVYIACRHNHKFHAYFLILKIKNNNEYDIIFEIENCLSDGISYKYIQCNISLNPSNSKLGYLFLLLSNDQIQDKLKLEIESDEKINEIFPNYIF